jgi:hypothetical protein
MVSSAPSPAPAAPLSTLFFFERASVHSWSTLPCYSLGIGIREEHVLVDHEFMTWPLLWSTSRTQARNSSYTVCKLLLERRHALVLLVLRQHPPEQLRHRHRASVVCSRTDHRVSTCLLARCLSMAARCRCFLLLARDNVYSD